MKKSLLLSIVVAAASQACGPGKSHQATVPAFNKSQVVAGEFLVGGNKDDIYAALKEAGVQGRVIELDKNHPEDNQWEVHYKGDADTARNLDLMQTRSWFDFPLLLNDDRIAKVVFQKSPEGQAMLEKAFEAWK